MICGRFELSYGLGLQSRACEGACESGSVPGFFVWGFEALQTTPMDELAVECAQAYRAATRVLRCVARPQAKKQNFQIGHRCRQVMGPARIKE